MKRTCEDPDCPNFKAPLIPSPLDSGQWSPTRDEKGEWRQLICPQPTCWQYATETRPRRQ